MYKITNYLELPEYTRTMQNKRYLVHPGYLFSKNGLDKHYIDFKTLCRLYKVHHSECVNVNNLSLCERNRLPKLIDLKPDYSGNYTIPEEP